jgi:hypothetical protein
VSSAVSGWYRSTLLIRPALTPLDVDYYNLSVARPSTGSSSRCISGGGMLGLSSTTSLRMVMALPLVLAVTQTVKLLHNNSQAQTILCYCLLLHTAAYWHRPHSLHIYTITLSLTRQTIYPLIHSFIP